MDKYNKPSNGKIRKAYMKFDRKIVNSAINLIDVCDKGQLEGEFISDTDQPTLDECLIFLLEGQR